MGFSFAPTMPGNVEGMGELEEFQRLTSQLRNLITQEAGFNQAKKTVSLEEGLNLATPAQKKNYDLLSRDIQEIEQRIAQGEANGEDPDSRFMWGTQAGREAGFGIGSFTLNELKAGLQDRYRNLEGLKSELTNVQSFEKTAERLEQENKLKELQTLQENIFRAQAEEQQKAFDGEVELSAPEKEAFDTQFKALAEAARRKGIDIEGDSIETAVARGTAGQSFLKNFQSRMDLAKEARRESILGRNPMYQAAAGSIPTFGAGYAGTMPAGPNLQGFQAIQQGFNPFFQNQQLQLQQQMINAQGQGGSGKAGLVGSLAGAGIGALLAAPTGGMSMLGGAYLGNTFGGGIGNLFSGGY